MKTAFLSSLAALVLLSTTTFAIQSPKLETPDESQADAIISKPESDSDAPVAPLERPTDQELGAPAEAAEPPSADDPNMSVTIIPKGAKPKAKAAAKPDSKAASTVPSKAKATASKPAAKTEVKKAASVEPTAPSGEVSAEQSLKWLTNGNTRFVTKKFRADGRSSADRERTTKEQKPHAIVLSCSDSRVPPELVFDQGLGEIASVRVAGEVLDSSVIASLETIIQNQHPHLLVVLGHTHCDTVEAALSWKDKATQGSDALDRLSAEIKPHLKSAAGAKPSPGLEVESALQADGVSRELTDRSEIIKKAVESGALTIKTGLYWVDTGAVKFY